MKPLISLIIPVYNVEKYFSRCMDSVLNQTYRNYEVILIDDGSSDGSSKMCDDYAQNDKRVKVFHQENKGQSVARNYGVIQSKGELISFVDSDDFISEDYLEYLYALMEKYSVKLSCARLEKYGYKYAKVIGDSKEFVLSASDALIKLCYEDGISASPCAKLYHKEILIKYPYPEGVIYEDLATTYKLIAESDTICFGNKVIYHYVIHQGSTMHRTVEEQQFVILDAATEQLNFMIKYYPEVTLAAQMRCVKIAIGMLSRNEIFNDNRSKKNFKHIRDYIVPYSKIILKNKVISLRLKIQCLIILLGYYPSKICWNAMKRIKESKLFKTL